MTNREAIERIKDHIRVHKIGEYPHIHIAEALNLAITALESPRPDWTPCDEGLPKNTASYKVTVQVGSETGTWRDTMIIPYLYSDGVGEWVLPKSDWLVYTVIAWTKADEPYRADQKEDADNG